MEKELHHANIVTGEDGRDFTFNFLAEKLDFKAAGNPDFLFLEGDTFGIDNARELSLWTIGRPLLGGIKAALVVARSMTLEAQNALLKTLEEPPEGTYIFINIENSGNLLPTLLSRVRILSPKNAEGTKLESATEFLSSSLGERLAMARSVSKKTDKNALRDLINRLEESAREKGTRPEDLKKILKAKIFAAARGSSPKMVMEWLSCVL